MRALYDAPRRPAFVAGDVGTWPTWLTVTAVGAAAVAAVWALVAVIGWVEFSTRPAHAEWRWRRVCVRSHDESTVIFVPVSTGKTTTIVPMPTTTEVCDAYAPQRYCRQGKDGSWCSRAGGEDPRASW